VVEEVAAAAVREVARLENEGGKRERREKK
jgi:hypothetical protein